MFGIITDVIGKSVVGPEGEDIIISDIRDDIKENMKEDNYYNVFFDILLYMVLLSFTISFSVQYLKRVVYVGFFTLVSPLIALTYPLDKLKDGKAQAFDTWLKEFIFNVMLQVIHLFLYFILITSAGELATDNKIYALVAIGALLPAEKFIKKLFGLESSTSMGKMASALGGAAIMNSINKLGRKKPSSPKKTPGDGGNNANIRTVDNEVGNNPQHYSGGVRQGEAQLGGISLGELGNRQATEGQEKGNKNAKRNIKNGPSVGRGLGNVAKKAGRYVFNKNTGKKLLRGTAKVAGSAALGTVGLAAGIATGEPENAFAGALGGISAGSRVGANLVDGGANLITGAKDGLRNLGDTFKEGKYGEKEYAKMKKLEAFKNSEGYKKLASKYQGRENEINDFLDAEITDANKIEIALENNYSVQDTIKYMKMAKQCPDGVLYSNERFEQFLLTREEPIDNAEEIRKAIVSFK